jgi:large subunit ribosomal protein L10
LALTAEDKRERIAEYTKLLKGSQGLILAEFVGLDMKGINSLRGRVREATGTVVVTKNTLLEIAMREAGLSIPGEHLAGTTLVVFASSDVVAIAKAVADTAKEQEALRVKGGLLGSRVMSREEVRALAELPPRPVLEARLLGLLQAPAGKLLGVLQAPARQMMGVLKARAEKLVEAPAP